MSIATVHPDKYLGRAVVIALLYNTTQVLYIDSGRRPPGIVGAVCLLSFVCLCYSWINADSARFQTRSVATQGHFIVLAWPIALIHHLVSTRGKKAVLTLLFFLGIWLLTFLPGIVFVVLLQMLFGT